ncbi:MAG TPA: hypothetical protein VM305_08395 [Candidatus Limnocylindrales bacterium]|nr:hypothetical protein [Candidatus Limnocylindrales bacterium]
MNTTAALRGWTEAGLHKVLLPTGTWVRVRLPSVEHLLRKGVFPQELTGMAIRFTMERLVLRELDPAEQEQFLQMKDRLIAYCVRERLVAGESPDDPAAEWGELDLTPFILDLESVIPAEDLDALGFIAIRHKQPATVTAESLLKLGLVKKIAEMQEGEAAPAAGEFRRVDNDAKRAATSGDSGAVLVPTELGNGDHGSGPGASDRSGAVRKARRNST